MTRSRFKDVLYTAFLKLIDALVYSCLFVGAMQCAGIIAAFIFNWHLPSWEIVGASLPKLVRGFLVFVPFIAIPVWIALLMGMGERR